MDRGEVFVFKELRWQILRIKDKNTVTTDLTPLRPPRMKPLPPNYAVGSTDNSQREKDRNIKKEKLFLIGQLEDK